MEDDVTVSMVHMEISQQLCIVIKQFTCALRGNVDPLNFLPAPSALEVYTMQSSVEIYQY